MIRARVSASLQRRAGPSRRQTFSTTPQPSSAGYASTLRNLAAGPHSKVIVQGFTGKASTVHTAISMSMGTNVVGGTSPGKGGQTHLDRPVFNSVREAVQACQPHASSVFVPPALAAGAVLEAIEAEVPLVVCVAEGLPAKDQMKIMSALHSQSKTRLLGANSPGYCNPRGCRMGISPMITAAPGPVAIASRSGTVSYEASWATKHLGQSYILGLGGDFYPGTRTVEALEFFMNDQDTKAIILCGEVGGSMEEEVYELLSSSSCPYRLSPSSTSPRREGDATPFIKPIVGFMSGLAVPPGQTFGHAGAIWRDGIHSAQQKQDLWRRAGIRIAEAIADVGRLVEEELQLQKRMLAGGNK
ncbi:related to succinyl-coa ligase [gdp-forming] alpha-chain, mitochondrial precursor [Pseudozyma flocculosa]|uniref:Related to succinyl-coa ligase [gdp-forming] alpha-chain, mitochondrial n=2 Tax=Pseudozyma flocculosa TaxID=84751 RepID=A0A5C3ES96_9BASI|nr:related to succinyl-coa ligase [gdp-forming] alpha-chain, mitochondrial precursor [Pseudozyma flocculosa]